MSATLPKLLTADEFWNSPLNQKGTELVRGEVETSMPTSGDHGRIAGNLCFTLKLWTRERGEGWVGLESGFLLSQDPTTLRAPDVAYVRPERVPVTGVPGYWRHAPDLAIEVVSPSDSAHDVQSKVNEYLHAGTGEVWVAYPGLSELVIHRPNGIAQRLGIEDQLITALLPGFSCRVSELFSQ